MRLSPELLARAARAGYQVRLVEFCEDASTPGFPGQIGGKCDHARKMISVSFRRSLRPGDYRSGAELDAILAHECEHAEGLEIASDNPEHGLICGGSWRGLL